MVSLCDRLWVSVRLACERLHLAISHSMCELFFFYSFSYVSYAWWTRVVSSDLSVPMGFHVIFAKTFNKYLNIMCLFLTHPTMNPNPPTPSSTLSSLQWLELQWILCAWLLCIIIAYVKLLRFRHFHRWCSDVVWSRVEVSIGPFFPTFSGLSRSRMFQNHSGKFGSGGFDPFLKFGARVIFGAFEPKCPDTKFHVSLWLSGIVWTMSEKSRLRPLVQRKRARVCGSWLFSIEIGDDNDDTSIRYRHHHRFRYARKLPFNKRSASHPVNLRNLAIYIFLVRRCE